MNRQLLLLMLMCMGVVYQIMGCNGTPEHKSDNSKSSQVETPPEQVDDEHDDVDVWEGVSIGGTRRVNQNQSNPIVPDGYLDEKESLEWLSNNGYEVVNTKSEFSIKKEEPDYYYNPNISQENATGVTYIRELPERVSLLYQNGKIYI